MHAHSVVTQSHNTSKRRNLSTTINPNPSLPMASSSPHPRQADGDDADALEEGEFVPGYNSVESDDTGPSLESRREEEIRRPPRLSRGLEEIPARERAAMSPSYEYGESDGTISDDDGGPASFSAGGVDVPMRRLYPGNVCGKGFGNPKAVDRHMMVHGSHHGQENSRYVDVSGDFLAATGKRGCTGSKGPTSDGLNHSMATLLSSDPNRPLQPTPLAFARSNLSSSLSMASARTNLELGKTSSPHLVHDEARVAAAGANPSIDEVFVHQQPAAPQQPHQVVLQLAPVVPPVQGPAAAPPREYTCKICGKKYPSNQALGGHAAGHKNRQKEDEAAAAGIGKDGNVIARKGRREHRCKKCDKVFPTGVALGGHMRMHYNGPPIVHSRKSKKRCVAPPAALPAPPLAASPTLCMEKDLTLALGIKTGQPSQSPPAVRRLRLFGVDIAPSAAEAPAVQEGADIKPQVEAPQEGSSQP